MDPVGAGLSIVGLVSLVFAIIEAPSRGWTDPLILAAFALGLVFIVVFLWWETRTAHPMLRLEFFENPRFSAASVAITLVFFALFGTIFLLTQYLQFVLGFSPLEAGLRIMPIATLIVAAPLAARITERIGTKIVVSSGLLIVTVALGILALITIDSSYSHMALGLALVGIGMGATMAPATDSIMGSLPLAKSGVGSAMNDTTRQVGGALGVAILGSIMASIYASTMAPAVAPLPPEAAEVAGDSIGGALAVASNIGAAAEGLVVAAQSAFVDGMQTSIWVAAAVALVGAILTWRFLPARALDTSEPALASDDQPPSSDQQA